LSIELMMKTYKKYCSKIPIRNSRLERKLWLTTSVAITLCIARDLSRDLGVVRRVYIKSGIAMFSQVLLTAVIGVASNL